jgi:hypothetical protein
MANHTHLVVAYNHDTKTFWFDGDGSREWIRRLFTPETNTWSDEEEEFIPEDLGLVADAMTALEALNIEIDETDGWLTR